MEENTEKNIEQLQLIEQNMQNLMLQKQQFQSQLIEVESALKELENTDKPYKIVGNIMVSTDKEELKKSLDEKKEKAELRIKNLEKQENSLKEKASSMQAEVMNNLKK